MLEVFRSWRYIHYFWPSPCLSHCAHPLMIYSSLAPAALHLTFAPSMKDVSPCPAVRSNTNLPQLRAVRLLCPQLRNHPNSRPVLQPQTYDMMQLCLSIFVCTTRRFNIVLLIFSQPTPNPSEQPTNPPTRNVSFATPCLEYSFLATF